MVTFGYDTAKCLRLYDISNCKSMNDYNLVSKEIYDLYKDEISTGDTVIAGSDVDYKVRQIRQKHKIKYGLIFIFNLFCINKKPGMLPCFSPTQIWKDGSVASIKDIKNSDLVFLEYFLRTCGKSFIISEFETYNKISSRSSRYKSAMAKSKILEKITITHREYIAPAWCGSMCGRFCVMKWEK